jgi:outer membrane receptor for ferrienterochelin and colicins
MKISIIQYLTFLVTALALTGRLNAQNSAKTGVLQGRVLSNGKGLELATVKIKDLPLGAVTDAEGKFLIREVPTGNHILIAFCLGFETLEKEIILDSMFSVELELRELHVQVNQVVVTGTRTFKRQTASPVIVNIVSSRTLEGVQACNLSEGLKFQPGLRVETDCQTCNYTQLRMNGLAGGYSQILVNGRPIFSPLTGLYGLEQIPANMIERIEVVRGGGSALYGAGAVGGTVNVITKIPQKNAFDISYNHQYINGQAHDANLSGNATLRSASGKTGLSLFLNSRNRDWYDHNGDRFSELPAIRNRSAGAGFFFLPDENQKLEISFSHLNEYRYGGETTDLPPHLAQQAEERRHEVWIGSADYQINFNEGRSALIAYLGAQRTDRTHYTGIFPDADEDIRIHLQNPPYGSSDNSTLQGGLQFSQELSGFPGLRNVLTIGSEFIYDDVLDQIPAYQFIVDQTTRNLGVFAQSDWEISQSFNLLTGLRLDRHNLLDRTLLSPRVSLLYKLRGLTQFRLSYGAGFRAPQAFDADMHIAFAGGGVSRISLSPELREERSNSWSLSVNHDHATEKWIAGVTLEGFYTKLNHAFFLDPVGADAFGERFVKSNGDGAAVQGATLEIRANYNQKAQLEAGFTLQSSLFDTPVENIEGLAPARAFLRTPNDYGYAMISWFPNKNWSTTLNLVYTGRMQLAHFGGAPEQTEDAYKTSPRFAELGLKTGYTFPLAQGRTGLELFGGVKNLFNAYQNDFDSGKNRDSNYIYGPAQPRTLFVGLRVKSL